MLITNSSKTLEHLKNKFSLTEIQDNPVNLGLFSQIYSWLQTKPNKMSQYKSHSKIAERRDELNLNLFKKKNENSKDSLKVLKKFPLTVSSFISCFIRDAAIPLLINDASVLKCGEIFLFKEVTLYLSGSSEFPILFPKLKVKLIYRKFMWNIHSSKGQI